MESLKYIWSSNCLGNLKKYNTSSIRNYRYSEHLQVKGYHLILKGEEILCNINYSSIVLFLNNR